MKTGEKLALFLWPVPAAAAREQPLRRTPQPTLRQAPRAKHLRLELAGSREALLSLLAIVVLVIRFREANRVHRRYALPSGDPTISRTPGPRRPRASPSQSCPSRCGREL